MANRITLQAGRPPWLPHEYAIDLDAWHYDDVPTVGTFKLGRMTVLFCADGEVHSGRVHWWYADISEDQPMITNVWTDEEMTHWVNQALEVATVRAEGWSIQLVLATVS
jgi:hypothetical protein